MRAIFSHEKILCIAQIHIFSGQNLAKLQKLPRGKTKKYKIDKHPKKYIHHKKLLYYRLRYSDKYFKTCAFSQH
jgi:hypothetical protein